MEAVTWCLQDSWKKYKEIIRLHYIILLHVHICFKLLPASKYLCCTSELNVHWHFSFLLWLEPHRKLDWKAWLKKPTGLDLKNVVFTRRKTGSVHRRATAGKQIREDKYKSWATTNCHRRERSQRINTLGRRDRWQQSEPRWWETTGREDRRGTKSKLE